jgi:hypothetical protein
VRTSFLGMRSRRCLGRLFVLAVVKADYGFSVTKDGPEFECADIHSTALWRRIQGDTETEYGSVQGSPYKDGCIVRGEMQ